MAGRGNAKKWKSTLRCSVESGKRRSVPLGKWLEQFQCPAGAKASAPALRKKKLGRPKSNTLSKAITSTKKTTKKTLPRTTKLEQKMPAGLEKCVYFVDGVDKSVKLPKRLTAIRTSKHKWVRDYSKMTAAEMKKFMMKATRLDLKPQRAGQLTHDPSPVDLTGESVAMRFVSKDLVRVIEVPTTGIKRMRANKTDYEDGYPFKKSNSDGSDEDVSELVYDILAAAQPVEVAGFDVSLKLLYNEVTFAQN